MEWEHVLAYWFRGLDDFDRWFKSDTVYDREISDIFSSLLRTAERGKLNWEDSARSYLAHVILLDQFSRHVYRGTEREYSNDGDALRVAERGLHHLTDLNPVEQMFAVMPYQHSERASVQARGVRLLRKLLHNARESRDKRILRMALNHQMGHRSVIRRFGRFPKRNATIGRRSTHRERAYIRRESRRRVPRPY